MAILVVKVEGGVPEALTAAVKEVFAEIPFELLPKSDGARELAIDQEDGKKAAERLRHHVADGVCEGLDPFMAVLREATGDAGLTKSRVDDPLVSVEVLKARGARHSDEEETEEEAITSGWMDGVHAAHGVGAVGAELPPPRLGFPGETIHDLGVFECTKLGVVLHELEEGSEFGVFGALLNRPSCLAFFERNHLVAGQMNWKAVNSRVHTMHIHLQDSVNCLGSGDVAALQVCVNLVLGSGPAPAPAPNEHALRLVVALVHVLVHVLDGADAAADLDVDVTVVLQQQGGIVGHHPLVGELDGVTRSAVGMRPDGSATVVGAGVGGVGVVTGLRLSLERLGKVFRAGSVAHARRFDVVPSATGPVEHVLGDGRIKTWLGFGIGELGGDNGVYVGRRAGFVLRSEVDEYVRVWKAPLLELDDKEVGHHLAQNLPFSQVVHKSFPLQVEHARAKVRPVGG